MGVSPSVLLFLGSLWCLVVRMCFKLNWHAKEQWIQCLYNCIVLVCKENIEPYKLHSHLKV